MASRCALASVNDLAQGGHPGLQLRSSLGHTPDLAEDLLSILRLPGKLALVCDLAKVRHSGLEFVVSSAQASPSGLDHFRTFPSPGCQRRLTYSLCDIASYPSVLSPSERISSLRVYLAYIAQGLSSITWFSQSFLCLPKLTRSPSWQGRLGSQGQAADQGPGELPGGERQAPDDHDAPQGDAVQPPVP